MDIAKRLKDAVNSLPDGDHKHGLISVIRHVDAAIRHYERALQKYGDDDACTDCIYRTNQIYEGSLKEAYRVISGQSVENITPHQIEEYLTKGSLLRHRVLEQLTRYRKDYRNPSTHDYKLDFDDNEALLAILNVIGFAILLIDQMKSHLDVDALQSNKEIVGNIKLSIGDGGISQFAKDVSENLCSFLKDTGSRLDLSSWETSSVVFAFLEKSELNIVRDYYLETDEGWCEWDVLIKKQPNLTLPIEIKTSRGVQSKEITESRIEQVYEAAVISGHDYAILVEGSSKLPKYSISKHVLHQAERGPKVTIYRIGNKDNSPAANVV